MTYSYECPVCGEFEVEKPIAECSRPEKCPKCGADANRVWGCNIDQTMYQRDPTRKGYWRNSLSVSEQARVLNGERDPY